MQYIQPTLHGNLSENFRLNLFSSFPFSSVYLSVTLLLSLTLLLSMN